MPEPVIITSSQGSEFTNIQCPGCDEHLAISASDSFCPICSNTLPEVEEGSAVVFATISEPRLFCNTCETDIFSNSRFANESLASTSYCPRCGSVDVIAMEEEKATEDAEEETSDVQDKLADKDVDQMEAALLSQPEPQWVVFSKGQPVFSMKQSKQPEESKYIFTTAKFFSVFKQRAKETSLFAAVKEFNADVLDKTQIMSALDVEDAAYERLQAVVLPRFIDCVMTAIEGMTRNVYPDLSAELKACFYDELRARGIPDSESLVEDSFDSAGSKVFAAVFSKAMELYNKPDAVRAEIKSTIFSTNRVKSSTREPRISQDNAEFRARLIEGNVPVMTSEPIIAGMLQSSVEDMRTRLNLRRR